MKTLIQTSILFMLYLIMTSQTSAHGNSDPQHGGVIKVVGEYTFELVRHNKLTELYVSYENDALNANEMSGILKITQNKNKTKILLQSGQGNRFFIDQSINDGSTVLVILTLADGFSKIVAKYKL